MPLTDHERAVLGSAARTSCEPGCHCQQIARDIADDLRQHATDIDDITLARVLLHLAPAAFVAALNHDLDGLQLAALLKRTAVELASLEIGDIPQ